MIFHIIKKTIPALDILCSFQADKKTSGENGLVSLSSSLKSMDKYNVTSEAISQVTKVTSTIKH